MKGGSSSKRFGAVLAIAVIIALLIVFLGVIFGRQLYYRFIYCGDRITGSVAVITDEKALSYGEYVISGEGFSFGGEGNVCSLSAKADKYGRYSAFVDIPNCPQPVELEFVQYNWWNVIEFDITIDNDYKSNEMTLNYYYTTLNESGAKEVCSGSNSFDMEKDELIFRTKI